MRLLRLAAIALGAAAAQPASAIQSDYSTRETRALMHAYARCVVKREGDKASEALLANVDNSAILRDYKMLIDGHCLAREARATAKMSFSGDLYRYALADALVNQELAGRAVPDLAVVPRLAHREPGDEPARVTADGKALSRKKHEEAVRTHRESVGFSYLSKYGECVVRRNPEGARSLLLTVPDSTEETASFNLLRTALGTCLPEGETLEFGRVALRGTIAINYYRLAHAARSAGLEVST